MPKGRLAEDVWYIEEKAKNLLGCVLTKKEIDDVVRKLGSKGDLLHWNEKDQEFIHAHIGSFDKDSSFVEEFE